CGRRARRAEVVDAERDRLRDTVAAALLEQVKQGRELEEGAEDAAVHRGQGGIADDLPPEREDALEGAVRALDLDPEEARVEDRVHRTFASRPRMSRSKELSLQLAPSMNVPRALANGSAGLRSQATARTNATVRVSR